jgi:hypothetical protein
VTSVNDILGNAGGERMQKLAFFDCFIERAGGA